MSKRSIPAAIVGFTLVATACLMLGLAATPHRLRPLPRAAQRPPEVSLADAIARIDPSVDEWESEAFSEAAQAQLDRLGALLMQGKPVDSQVSRRLASARFSCPPLRPPHLEAVFRDGSLSVLRAPEPIPTGAGTVSHRGPDALMAALKGLSEPLDSQAGMRVEFQIFRAEVKTDSADTTAYFHIDGPAKGGFLEVNATWRIRWTRSPSTDSPLLDQIAIQQHEEVIGRPGGGTMFADSTEAVLGGDRSFREQLLPGTDHWLSRIESWIESDSFGHHGIAIGDVNGDGLDDLYLGQMGGLPNLLYVQNPDGTVTDRSAESGVDWLERTRGVLFVDLDNDGDQDLVAATSVALLFLSNDGTGRFTVRASLSASEGIILEDRARDIARGASLPVGGEEAGHYYRGPDLGGVRTSDLVSLAAADYDNDGRLDIYACAYHASSEEADRFPIPIPYHDANNGGPDLLLRNEGDWKFTDVTKTAGLDANNRRFSFAASWEDYDGDGDQDLFVANDFGRKNLYRNDRGKFIDAAAEAGVEDVGAGMSVSWGDYDNDGRMDLYVGNMFSAAGSRVAAEPRFQQAASPATRELYRRHARGNSLFHNSGDGKFRDVSVESATTIGRWAWSSNFLDMNNDGWEDLLVANGYFTKEHPRDLSSYFWRRVVGLSPPEAVSPESAPEYAASWRTLSRMIRQGHSLAGRERNCVFLNTGGTRFAAASAISGLDFDDDGRAVAVTDWDLDGDLDVWLVNRTGPRVRFARNETRSGHDFLAVSLEGRASNRDAIGARLTLELKGKPGRKLTRSLRAGDGYLSQSSKLVHFGLGASTGIEKLVVVWPSGKSEAITGLSAGGRYKIVEGEGRAVALGASSRSVKLASSKLEAPRLDDRARVFLSVPAPAPIITYTDMQGRQTGLDERQTGPMLLTLWTSACDPCAEELAQITQLAARAEDLRKGGLRVLALSGEPDPAAARRLLEQAGFSFETGLAPPELIDKLQILHDKTVHIPTPLPSPTSFLIDTDGLVGAIYRGAVPVDRIQEDLPALRSGAGARRLAAAIPFPGLRQTSSFPSLFDHMDKVARAYAEGGHPEDAVAYYRKVLRIQPGRVEARMSLGVALAEMGKVEEAIQQYREVLAVEPGHIAALSNLGQGLAAQGKTAEAIELYGRALEKDPDNALTLSNLGAALAEQGRLDEAIVQYRRALALDPANPPALNNLAVALARKGNNQEAVVHYRRLLDLEPANVAVRLNMGVALTRLGKHAEAVEHLTEAVRLRPDLPRALFQLGLALARAGRTDEAAGRLGEAMGLPPGSPEAFDKLAWILATSQDATLRDGARAVEAALGPTGQPRGSSFSSLDVLAAAYAEAGRFAEAVATARKAVDLAMAGGQPDQAQQIDARLRLYVAGQPYRDGPQEKR